MVTVAWRYASDGLLLTNLINEGNIGLIQTAKRFDPSRGVKFITAAAGRAKMASESVAQLVHISADLVTLDGILAVPAGAAGVVLFAHGSGSSRHSPRNTFVAEVLQRAGLGALLIDLLSQEEDASYEACFDIHLLAKRLTVATHWLRAQPPTKDLGIGYFGASTGAAAALQAAAASRPVIRAIVSRGGRPDLAWAALQRVQAPTLLIVGGRDDVVIELNQRAYARLHADKRLVIIPGATHLFEEPGTLPEVARLAAEWFSRYLPLQTTPDR